jgi:putative ABC transport system permease protein
VVLGVAASLGLSRVMESLIYGVNASDPIVFSAVCLLLTVVALVATYIPSRRATRIDPVEALRHE